MSDLNQAWGYKTRVHSQTQNKAHWLAACGLLSASSQSLHFILSLRLYSSFITSRPDLNWAQGLYIKLCLRSTQLSLKFIMLINSTIVGILTCISMINKILRVWKQEKSLFFSILVFMSSSNFMLSWVEHEKIFITPVCETLFQVCSVERVYLHPIIPVLLWLTRNLTYGSCLETDLIDRNRNVFMYNGKSYGFTKF